MTTDLPHIHPTEDDIGREPQGPVSGSHSQPAVSPSPVPGVPALPDLPALPPCATPDTPVLTASPAEARRSDQPAEPLIEPPTEPSAEPPAEPSAVLAEADEAARAVPEAPAQDDTGDEAIHTLLTTAATERPVNEVAALVARLQETGELSSPADVALRAAAVTRPWTRCGNCSSC